MSALFAPQALATAGGLPYAMVRYPSYPPSDSVDRRDTYSHYLIASRLYLLLADADVNLIYYFSNRYQEDFAKKSRFALSASRYFWQDYELHVEALATRGSARSFAERRCVLDASRCASSEGFAPTKLDERRLYPRVLVGARRQFATEGLLSLEYYYQGDGYSRTEFRDVVTLLARAKQKAQEEQSERPGESGSANDVALPQRASFSSLRRHYLIASFTQPHIRDDWTLSTVLLAGVQDSLGSRLAIGGVERRGVAHAFLLRLRSDPRTGEKRGEGSNSKF
ncbi:MAG: hypothetical protein QM784_29245 [Polyangiaceae bacterium]